MGDTWPRSSLVGISAPGMGSGWTIELEAGVGLMNGKMSIMRNFA